METDPGRHRAAAGGNRPVPFLCHGSGCLLGQGHAPAWNLNRRNNAVKHDTQGAMSMHDTNTTPELDSGTDDNLVKLTGPAHITESAPRREQSGWHSPTYNTSRMVTLDPNRVAANRCVCLESSAREMEYYRVLRTKVLHAAQQRGGNSIMITSALPDEGKTLTAINLAFTFAREFEQTALLVDCDLRRQKVQDYLGISGSKGLVDYLVDGCSIPDLMVWPGVEKLTMISGGRTVVDSSELLNSPRMRELVAEMKGRYENRYLFFDTPPVLCGADTLAFAPLVDHILFVVRAGQTPLQEINRALSMLPREKVIGLVMNRQDSELKNHNYYR
ncbi:MAG: tyrosine protein kinase [Desulfuromonadales bacterium]|nr:tyrosine protein kinase [Desulfuromonadales bacterium]